MASRRTKSRSRHWTPSSLALYLPPTGCWADRRNGEIARRHHPRVPYSGDARPAFRVASSWSRACLRRSMRWLQFRMSRMAGNAVQRGEALPALFWSYDRWWTLFGIVAFVAFLAIFYLMVVKPAAVPRGRGGPVSLRTRVFEKNRARGSNDFLPGPASAWPSIPPAASARPGDWTPCCPVRVVRRGLSGPAAAARWRSGPRSARDTDGTGAAGAAGAGRSSRGEQAAAMKTVLGNRIDRESFGFIEVSCLAMRARVCFRANACTRRREHRDRPEPDSTKPCRF